MTIEEPFVKRYMLADDWCHSSLREREISPDDSWEVERWEQDAVQWNVSRRPEMKEGNM